MKHSIIVVFTLFLSLSLQAETYYISSSEGRNNQSGLTSGKAWKSLDKLSDINIEPGDSILLKSGDSFQEPLVFENVQGSKDQFITVTTYGDTGKALIDGNGAIAAIHCTNPAYLQFINLEVINPDNEFGIKMDARDAGALGTVILSDLDVHDVFEESFESTNTPKTRGGIVFQVRGGETPTWWEEIVIENSKIHDLGSCGISIGSDYKVNKRVEPGEKTYPILGVQIRNNIIHDIVRDGAIIRQCKGGVMEENEVFRTGLTSVSNGMWFYDSDSCLIQNNIGHHCKAAHDKDGGAFSLDNSTSNCTIQYNYTYANEGAGYMLFGHDGYEHGNAIKNNISYNDHTACASEGIGSIALVSKVKDAVVADNIIIAGPATISVLGHRNWDGRPEDVLYRNNLFVGNGTAFLDKHTLSGSTFKDNFFINIADLPEQLQSESNKVSDYYQRMQEMLDKYDDINSVNVDKY